MASELPQNGLTRSSRFCGLTRWMEEYEYESVNQMQGQSQPASRQGTGGFERANYMKVLQSCNRTERTGWLDARFDRGVRGARCVPDPAFSCHDYPAIIAVYSGGAIPDMDFGGRAGRRPDCGE